MKVLNVHLRERAIYNAQYTERQGIELVFTAVFQEPLIISS